MRSKILFIFSLSTSIAAESCSIGDNRETQIISLLHSCCRSLSSFSWSDFTALKGSICRFKFRDPFSLPREERMRRRSSDGSVSVVDEACASSASVCFGFRYDQPDPNDRVIVGRPFNDLYVGVCRRPFLEREVKQMLLAFSI